MKIRPGEIADKQFIVQMAQYACSLEDRPNPGPDDEAVIQMGPTTPTLCLSQLMSMGIDSARPGPLLTTLHF